MFRKLNSKKLLAENSTTQLAETESTYYAASEEDGTYATIDGGMITRDEVDLAVNRGAGIFIGNYFVGITESYQCYINSPFGRFS